jgi:hypothetical protein
VDKAFLFAFAAAANPTLLTAVTVMLLLPSPKRLLLGYLLGAYMTSITIGLLIVFALHNAGSVSTTKRTLGPAADLALGAILIVIAFVLGTGRDQPFRQRRGERKRAKQRGEPKEPLVQRWLGRGSARVTFAAGAVLTLPGVSYLIGMDRIDDQNLAAPVSVLAVVLFNVIMLALIEVPLLGYAIAPERTTAAVDSFKAWLARSGRRMLVRGAAILGALLILRGVIEFIT